MTRVIQWLDYDILAQWGPININIQNFDYYCFWAIDWLGFWISSISISPLISCVFVILARTCINSNYQENTYSKTHEKPAIPKTDRSYSKLDSVAFWSFHNNLKFKPSKHHLLLLVPALSSVDCCLLEERERGGANWGDCAKWVGLCVLQFWQH